MKINFFDTNTGNSAYCNMHWPCPEIEYIKPPVLDYDGITVFTDEMCFHPVVDKVKSKYKIAWAFESPAIKPYAYDYIQSVEHKFDAIYTCWPERYNNLKYKQCYFGACWVPKQLCKLYDKTKLLSIVASNKSFTEGHKLRHEVIRRKMHPELELWGSGYKWFSDEPEDRAKPFKDYMYSIVIENTRYPGYFTDKIVDCFATGTIPIYWGNPKIQDLFDTNGIYVWNTIEELQAILKIISPKDYYSRQAAIRTNHQRYTEFASPDKWMLDNCYAKFI